MPSPADKSISKHPPISTGTKGVLGNTKMATLGVTKTLKNAVTNAAAQTAIALVLTAGFVGVQILAGLDFIGLAEYGTIMLNFLPLEAVVVGFYFAVNIKRNGTTTPNTASTDSQLIPVVDNLIREVTSYNATIPTIMQTLTQINSALQLMGKALSALNATDTPTPASEPAATAEVAKAEPKAPSMDTGDPDGLLHR